LHPGPAGSARTIRVIRVDGGYFALGAPMTSAALRDDEFDAKARRILAQLASHVPDHAERVAAVATLSAPRSRRWRRIAGALVVLVMAFFLIDAVDESVTGVDLLAHGVRTTASVQAVDRSGRNPQYLLRVALAGGGSNDAWTGAVPGRHAVGETIAVAYSPSDPATVKSVTELGRWWIHPLLMVFIGAGLGWLGTVLWRLKPLWFLSRRGSSPAGSRGPER
jgi:hypothetical protein